MNSINLPPKPRKFTGFGVLAIAILIALCIRDLDLNFQTVLWGYQDIIEYFSRYGKPDFAEWEKYTGLMVETICTALWGTFVAFIFGFVTAPLACRMLAPNRRVFRVAKELLNAMRAMPDLLLALIFVSSLGLGPLPGVLALGIHTGGFLGKFFAESLDRVPSGRYEALTAVGASTLQKTFYAGWPSILRETAGYTLYIFDRNVRMSSVLGLVGAGGIGLELHDTLSMFNYNQAAALIIFIIVTIFLIDYLASITRKCLA